MDADKFIWSEDEEQFVYQDDENLYDFLLTVAMGIVEPTGEELSAAVEKAARNFPEFLDMEAAHKRKAHQEIDEAIGADDFPDFETFSKQMELEEACLADGDTGHLYYRGKGDFSGYRVTIYCDGLQFHSSEIEKLD